MTENISPPPSNFGTPSSNRNVDFRTTSQRKAFHTDVSTGGFYDAVADGSSLRMAYSASKRRDQSVAFNLTSPDVSDECGMNDKEAIDMVRLALSRLSAFTGSNDGAAASSIKDIVALLQVRKKREGKIVYCAFMCVCMLYVYVSVCVYVALSDCSPRVLLLLL